MKKLSYLLTFILSFIILANSSFAILCGDTELNDLSKEAGAVKVTYEEKKENDTQSDFVPEVDYELDETYSYYFNINILNITDKIYVTVYNPNDNTTKTFTSADAVNGVASFLWKDLTEVANLKVTIYASSNTSCPNYKLLEIGKTIPMFNVYYDMPYCLQKQDEKICQKYVTSKVTSDQYNKLVKRVDEENTRIMEKENRKSTSIINYIKNNWLLITIIGSTVLIIGVAITVVIIKKKRSRSI